MKHSLPRISPHEAGIDAAAATAFIDYIESCGTEMHGLMILRHGKVALEGWWQPYSPVLRHASWSMTKSYVATAVGLAYDEGLLGVDDYITGYFPEDLPENPSDRLKGLKVRHLLSMSCGMRPEGFGRSMDNWIRDFFADPIVDEPGSSFFYNNSASSILALLVKKVSGQDFISYLRSRVFDKIGIEPDEISCIQLRDGNLFGAAGIFSTTEANVRMGLLYLQKGVWDGCRILSEEFIQMASSKQVDVKFPPRDMPEPPEIKDRMKHAGAGYGFQMWMCAYPGSFRFDGAMGQYVVMVPELDLLVAINQSSTACPEGPMSVVNAVFDILVPGVKSSGDSAAAGSESTKAEALLTGRMLKLSMPRLPAVRNLPLQERAAGAYSFEADGISLVPDIYAHLAERPDAITEPELSFSGNECFIVSENVRITAGMDGIPRVNFLNMNLPIEGYAMAEASWNKDAALILQLRYPETNFSMSLTFAFAGDGSVEVVCAENMTFDCSPVRPRHVKGNRKAV